METFHREVLILVKVSTPEFFILYRSVKNFRNPCLLTDCLRTSAGAYFLCGEGCRSKQGLVWRRVRSGPVRSGQVGSKHHIVSCCHLTQLLLWLKMSRGRSRFNRTW